MPVLQVTQLLEPSSSEAAEEPPSKKQRTCQSPQQSQGGTHASAEPSTQQPGVSGMTTSCKGAAPTPTPSTTTATAGNEGSYGESTSASGSGQGRSAVRPGSRTIRHQQHHPNKAAAVDIAEMQAHELHTKLVEVKMIIKNGAPEDASAAYSQAQQQLEKLQKAMEDVEKQLVDHATN